MSKLIWLPLEPFEWRYTEQWYRWFPMEFQKHNIPYLQIDGNKLTDKIEQGSVLDIYGTSYWKCTQLAKLISMMRSGEITSSDTLLFADLWYPGIEALRYIGCQGGQSPGITGILHAGTYDPNDFTVRSGMRPWGHLLEEAWFEIYDKVFVATQYHKDLILLNHRVDPSKIGVTGLPFYGDELKEYEYPKEDLIVFPNRLDPEKQPREFDALKSLVDLTSVEWVKSAKVCKIKEQYYELLGRAKVAVSMSLQETFGIAMLEATALGCIPLVPDRLSYRELYASGLRYRSTSELVNLIRRALGNSQHLKLLSIATKAHHKMLEESISRMLTLLGFIPSEKGG